MLTLIYAWSCSHEGDRPEGWLFALAFICDVVIVLSFSKEMIGV